MTKIQLNSWWTNFLTGVLATAIGVGLTFGANNLVERNNRKKAQRQAAMMAIYDIDEMMHKFEVCLAREDAFYDVTMYLFANPGEIESASMDSLWMVSEYLHYDPSTMPEWYDESTEKIFTTSMDALMSLGDISFYRNVQECYHLRRDLMNQYSLNATFRKPITDDFITEYRKTLKSTDIYHGGTMKHDALARFVMLMFRQPEVGLYLQKYHTRNNAYTRFLSQIRLLNQENKFSMAISDDDIKRYVDTYLSKITSATPNQLVGTWEITRGPKTETYELRKDRTITYTRRTQMQLTFEIKEENINVPSLTPLVFTAEGQWSLHDDSLALQLDSTTTRILTFDLDMSKLPAAYLESHRDSVNLMGEFFREQVFQSIKMTVAQPETHKVSVSKAGNMMFWEEQKTLPWGEIQIDKVQYTKTTK